MTYLSPGTDCHLVDYSAMSIEMVSVWKKYSTIKDILFIRFWNISLEAMSLIPLCYWIMYFTLNIIVYHSEPPPPEKPTRKTPTTILISNVSKEQSQAKHLSTNVLFILLIQHTYNKMKWHRKKYPYINHRQGAQVNRTAFKISDNYLDKYIKT